MRGRLAKDDIAVAIHKSVSINPTSDAAVVDEAAAWVCLTPRPETGTLIFTHIARRLGFRQMAQHLVLRRLQQTTGRLAYTVPLTVVCPLQQQASVASMVTGAVQQCAFPGSQSFLACAPSDALSLLRSEGFFVEFSSGFQLTQHGLACLLMCAPFSEPERVATVSQQALQWPDPTAHLLMEQLETAGWQWQRFRAKRLRSGELAVQAYEIGSQKKWMTSGLHAHPQYLTCLLQAEDLRARFNIVRIPHNASMQVYAKILNGVQPEIARAMPALLDLQDDMETELLPLQGQPEAQAVAEEDELDGEQLDEETGEDEIILSSLEALDVVSFFEAPKALPDKPSSSSVPLAEAIEATPASTASSAGIASAVAAPQPQAAEPVPAALAGLAPRKPPADDLVESATADGQEFDWTTFKFGAFRFTSKRPLRGKRGQFAWEATCPFHARNSVTGCKKTMNVTPVNEDRFATTLRCLKTWCNEAQRFRLQREHLAFQVTPATCAPDEVLLARCIPASAAPAVIKTDVELDKEEQAAGAKAKAKGGAKAKAKAKEAPAKAKAKTKPKPKVKVAATADRNNASSTDSDSSSSSDSGSTSSNSGSSSD